MNINKISLGLLFLILALVVVPGALAAKGTHPAGMSPPANATGEAKCISCHASSGAQLSDGSGPVTCTSCHAEKFPATPAVTATTVAVTATPKVTTVEATAAPKTPGFGIVSAIVGLFSLFLVKRNNK
jgi:cytochrome c553